MEYRRLGGAGVKLSVVGLGTWLTFGRQVGAKAADALVGRALDLGIQFFDTADMYADGAAEEILGRVPAAHRRSHIVLATKVYGEMGPGPNDRGLSRKHIIAACELRCAALAPNSSTSTSAIATIPSRRSRR